MFNDARISAALESMIGGIVAPPVPLMAIRETISQPRPVPRRMPRYVMLAIGTAAAIVLVAMIPSIAPGLVQTVETRIAAVLRWQPPPPAPDSLTSAMTSEPATLATAQTRVSFRIDPPAGLPRNVVSTSISTTPTGIYTKATRSWRLGPPEVTFSYRRSNGQTFVIIADQFDPQAAQPPKYIFEDKGPAFDGHEILVKHENFVWRNGDQVMIVVEGEGIGASEIEAIRIAMHGTALPLAETRSALNSGTVDKLYKP